VIVPFVFLPRGRIFERVLGEALSQGRITPELSLALNDRAVKLAHVYEAVMILVVVALMVFRPF
jgi:hypothetical protein